MICYWGGEITENIKKYCYDTLFITLFTRSSKQQFETMSVSQPQRVFRMLLEMVNNDLFNSFMGTLKLQSNGPLYSSTMIGILAVDGWAATATFGTARRDPGGLRLHPVLSSLYQM